ncbi:MAG: ComEC/Rec2 family competence protein [Bacillota bacterium]
MQKRNRMRKLLWLVVALVLFAGCTAADPSSQTTAPASAASPPVQTTASQGALEVHFIDVGQADCVFIRQNEATLLIDAGNNADGSAVVGYIKAQGVQKLDTVIGTHPHEDHIGGLDNVIKTFAVGSIIMPKVSHTSKTYEDVLNAVEQKGLRVTTPVPGNQFMVGNAQCTILAPKSQTYENLNNYSVVVRLTFGKTAFLFTGDAEALSEQEMLLSSAISPRADVLKVGHHGSSSSSTVPFLEAVSPSIAVISVGKDNDYGHPSPQTIRRLHDVGATVYRTDVTGTIVVYGDGSSLRVKQ